MAVAQHAGGAHPDVGGNARQIAAPQRQLHQPRLAIAIDGKAGAIGAALGHHFQHLRQKLAEPGFQRAILQEQADNSAHLWLLLKTGDLEASLIPHRQPCQPVGNLFSCWEGIRQPSRADRR